MTTIKWSEHDCVRDHPNQTHLQFEVARCFREHCLLQAEVERLRVQVMALENAGMEQAAQLGEAEAEVERLRSCMRQEQDLSNTMSGEIRELHAEVERLRTELDACSEGR